MEKQNNVYLLVIKFRKLCKDGKYEDETWTNLYYSMDECLNKVFDYLKEEYWYFTDTSVTTGVKNMIADMHTEQCSCELYINEYSCRRERYSAQKELFDRYQEIVAKGGEELYEDLLAIVDHQRYYLNTFGEITRIVTVPQKITGKEVSIGNFKREECRDGKYTGAFRYFEGTLIEKEQKGADGKLYFGHSIFWYESLDEKYKSHRWDNYLECFYTEEEALQGALESYYKKAREYVTSDNSSASKDYLQEIAKDKIDKTFFSVWVVSNRRQKCHTLQDLRTAYTKYVGKMKPEARYDFLLSLLRYDERVYDLAGNYLRSNNKHQFLNDEYYYAFLPLFSRETADKLNYKISE